MNAAERSLKKHLEAQVLGRLKDLIDAWRKARRHPGEVHSVHCLRVSIRRLTQCLRAFDQLFDPDDVQEVRHRLHKAMDLCGVIRNCQVALELLETPDMPKTRSLEEHLNHQRSRASKKLKRKLEQRSKRPSKKHWADLLSTSSGRDGNWDLSGTVAENAGRVLPLMAGEFFAGGAEAVVAKVGYPRIHKFRLLTKRFRSTLDLLSSSYGAEGNQGLKELGDLQDCLGAINDCVASRALLNKYPQTEQIRKVRACLRDLLIARKAAFHTCWEEHFGSRKSWWMEWLALPTTTKVKSTHEDN